MGETGSTCLRNFAKLQSNRLTTKQGSSTAHTFLPAMYISLVSHIFDFVLWPMQGTRPRHGHFDLSCKNGKTSWNAFELGFAVWKLVTLKRKNGAGDFSRPSGDFSRLKGDFTRPTFFMHYFPLVPGHVPVEAHPKPNSNMFKPEQTLAIATSRCVTAEDRHMK